MPLKSPRKETLVLFHDGGPNHIETSPLIWTGFYVTEISVLKELIFVALAYTGRRNEVSGLVSLAGVILVRMFLYFFSTFRLGKPVWVALN